MAQKGQVPLLDVKLEAESKLSRYCVVANPTNALAQLVKGRLPFTKPLLEYFLNIRDELSISNSSYYKDIIELIEGLLLQAETHVCISLNKIFYTNINQRLTLEKLDEKSSLKKQDQFLNILNTLFSSKKNSPISFIVVLNKETRLYVESDAEKTISYLKSLTETQHAISSYSSGSYSFFNKSPPLAGSSVVVANQTVGDRLVAIKRRFKNFVSNR